MTRAQAGRRPAATRLAALTGAGGVLNALKFVLLPALLSAHELDVLAVGLLLAVTLAQGVGEPLATHSVLEAGLAGARRATIALAAAALLAASAAPAAAAAVLAPGLDLADGDLLALRLFAGGGLALVGLWILAGRLQRSQDFSGLGLVGLAPNLGLVAGLFTGSPPLIAASMLASVTIALLAATRRHPSQSPEAGAAGPRVGLGELVALSLATQLNLILLRTAGSDLPEGSLGALYIAAGVAALPVTAIAGSAASVSLPLWRRELSGSPLREAARVAGLAGALAGLIVVGLAVMDLALPEGKAIDPAVREALRTAIPIIVAGVPLYAAAWYLRSLAMVLGRAATLAALAAAGALAVPASRLVDDTLAAVCAGYVASTLPWLAGAVLMARRAVHGRHSLA